MKKLITISITVLALSLASLLAISCGVDMDFSISSDDEPETASIKLALDWYPNANHLGLFIAQQKGYFEEENLDVTMYTPSDPSTVLQTVGAGQDDVGMSYQPDVLLARNEGVPVVSILGVVQHPLNSLMTLESSGITTPGQLAGKKVGYPGIPTNEPLLETMLKADGLNGLEDIELVNIGWNISESLIGEKVDGVVGAYWTHESINMQKIGYPVNVMRMEEWGVPDYYELVLVTSEDYLSENEDVAERFVRAMKRGYEEAIGDPQAGVDVLVAANEGEIDESIDRPGADLLVPMWQLPSGGGFGTQEPARWNSFVQWMKDNGMLDQSLDASAAYRADIGN
ncbi:MAG: ABC transporter substrate-binding protein [Dehalococcoidia bacterium]|nr:ABC transporter substrate-binding protein [Dehalococcoidia bacterium]